MKSFAHLKFPAVNTLACTGLALALAGCGGGQSTGLPAGLAQSAPAAASTASPEFTPENFRRVAQTVSQALWFALQSTVTAVQVQELALGLEASTGLGHGVAGLHRAGAGGLTLSSVSSSSAVPTSLPCGLSGEVLVTAGLPSAGAPSAEPVLTAHMARCVEHGGWMADGRYSWSPERGSGRATADRPGSTTMRGEFQHLSLSPRPSATDDASFPPSSGHGTLRLNQLRLPLGVQEVEVMADMDTTMVGASGPAAVRIQQLRVHGTVAAPATASGTQQLRAEGAVSSAEFGHAIWQVRTVEPIGLSAPSYAPRAGHVTVTGPAGGRIHLRVLPGSNSMAVELDANGDGQIELSVTTPWMERPNSPW